MDGWTQLVEALGASRPLIQTLLESAWPWAAAITLLWSGQSKLRRPRLVALTMVDLGIVKRPLARYGLTLGLLELAFAGAALSQPFLKFSSDLVRFGLPAFFLVMLGVSIYARTWRKSDDILCACFGSGSAWIHRFCLWWLRAVKDECPSDQGEYGLAKVVSA